MLIVLKALGLAKEYNGTKIFEKVNLEIQQGERAALIGANGVGKSTLLGCFMNRIVQEEGEIYRRWPVEKWGVVEQHVQVAESMSVSDFVQAGDPARYQLKQELLQMERSMSAFFGAQLDQALERYGSMLEQYQGHGGYEWEQRAGSLLSRFHLQPELMYKQASGGQKTKAQLARAMLTNPPFLLMDEPTNHLDMETLDWLTGWLEAYPGTILFVSHDREFIDRLATKTVELTNHGTKTYKGGYADFFRERKREQREQEALYKKQVQEQRKLEEAIRHYKEWFAKAHAAAGERNPFYKKRAEKNQTRAKAKQQALERLQQEKVKQPTKQATIQVDFQEGSFLARHLIRMEQVSFGYGEKQVIQRSNLTISRGDRLAIIGSNGSGKTTMLKLLAGKLQPSSGVIQHHPALQIGYFAQELENLRPDETILDHVLALPGMTQSDARNILAAFLFRREDVYKKVGCLSMGERCRVAFVILYFSEANLLILDEPTNYLDIPARERIEDAISHYPGALVIVSHDRYLLKKTANRVARLEEGTIHDYPGSYEDYRQHQRSEARETVDRDKDDLIRSLQLELAWLMAQEEPTEPEKQQILWEQIRGTKQKLDQLNHTV